MGFTPKIEGTIPYFEDGIRVPKVLEGIVPEEVAEEVVGILHVHLRPGPKKTCDPSEG